MWVVEAGEQVLVAGIKGRPLGKSLGEPESFLAEIGFKAQTVTDCDKLLPAGVRAGDGRHGPPVHPGQVLLLFLGEGSTVNRAAVF